MRLNNGVFFAGVGSLTGDGIFRFSVAGGAAVVAGSKNRRCVVDDIFIDFSFFVSNEIALILFVIISLVSPGTLKTTFHVIRTKRFSRQIITTKKKHFL